MSLEKKSNHKTYFIYMLGILAVLLASLPAYAKSIVFNNANVYYEIQGSGDKCIVMVHGWACDSRYWEKQIEYFSQDYKVVTVDLPGHGQSEAPAVSYTMEYFAEAVIKVLNQEKLSDVILVGHSMGGTVAKVVSQLDPGIVKGIYIVDGALYLFDTPEGQGAFDAMLMQIKGKEGEVYTENFIRSMFSKKADPKLVEWIVASMLNTKQSVRISAMESLCNSKTWELKSVRVPASIVFAYNFTNPYTPTPADIKKQFPNVVEYSMLGDVGHFIMMEKPKLINKRILEFVASLR